MRLQNRLALVACIICLLGTVPAGAQSLEEAVVSIRGPIRGVHVSHSPLESGGWLYATHNVVPLQPGGCVRVVGRGTVASVRLRSGEVQRLRERQSFCVPSRTARRPSSGERVRGVFSGIFETVVTLLTGPAPPAWAPSLESRSDSAGTEPLLLLPDTLVWSVLDSMPALIWSAPSTREEYAIRVFPADEGCRRTGAAIAEGRPVDNRYTLSRALPRGGTFRVELARAGGPVVDYGCLRVVGQEEARQADEALRAIHNGFVADGGADPALPVFVAAWLLDAGLQVDALALLHAEAARAPQGAGGRAYWGLLGQNDKYLAPRLPGRR